LTLFQSIVRLIFQQNGPTVDISAKTSFHWWICVFTGKGEIESKYK
jgi:hypothetical protein